MITVGAERNTELATDLGDDLRRVVVVAQPRDLVTLHLDPDDGVHFVTRPPEEDRFSPVCTELATRRRQQTLVILVRAAEERALQGSPPDRLGPVLELEARVLHRRRVEEERRQAIEVARVEGVAKGVENGWSHRGCLLRFHGHQLGAPPV